MLIARLIADTGDVETRLEALRHGLIHTDVGIGCEATVEIMAAHALVELQLDLDEFAVASNIIDAHFGECDHLISAGPVGTPELFVSDMDSTMIGQECIDELADYAGLKPQIADITERAMQGELDFEAALRERVALLGGLDESAIARCIAERIRPTPGAETLTRTLRAHGTRCVLVTGGFHHFADRVAETLGFERVVGNRLEVAEGKLTGGLLGEITDSGTKAAVLAEEMAQLDADARSLATGDGANDIPMIEAATYGFAYHAKPKARAAANGRIDRGDLTSVLSLLGIAEKDRVRS